MINRILHSCSCVIEFIRLVVKSDKMLNKSSILSLLLNSINKFHITCTVLVTHIQDGVSRDNTHLTVHLQSNLKITFKLFVFQIM